MTAQTLVSAVTAAQGRVPASLERLLAAADLLTAPSGQAASLRPIVEAALRGELDAKKLDKLTADAVQQSATANLRQELRQIAEPMIVEQFHTQLKNGCADEILAGLRDQFTEHAEAIAEARSLIPAETDLTQWLSDARPEAIAAWQALPSHLGVMDRIGAIAANFGARPSAKFPLFAEPGYTDNRLVSDVALFCVAGGLIGDSAPFLRAGPTEHRASPWFAVGPLRLNTVAQAAARYADFCAAAWDQTHPNTLVEFTNPDGTKGEMQLTNPHREQVDA